MDKKTVELVLATTNVRHERIRGAAGGMTLDQRGQRAAVAMGGRGVGRLGVHSYAVDSCDTGLGCQPDSQANWGPRVRCAVMSA